jgi:hypothetical protein
MHGFDKIAENYSISDRTFVLSFNGAQVLALISLIQIARQKSTPAKFDKAFPELTPIAEGLIEAINQIDQAAGDQLRSGWDL